MGFSGDSLVDQLYEHEKISIVENMTIPPVIAAWDLGKGESQVLAHCLAGPSFRAVLDDKAARDCACSLDIPTAESHRNFYSLKARRSSLISIISGKKSKRPCCIALAACVRD